MQWQALSIFPNWRSRQTPLGLDLGTHSLAWFQLTPGAQPVMQCCLLAPLTDDADERRATIHESWRRLGVSQRHVALALPAHQVRYQILSLPRMPEHDLDAMLLNEAAQQLALAPHEISFDYQRLPPDTDANHDEIRVLLCAASLQEIHQRIDLVEQAGLCVSHLDVESFALLRIGAYLAPWSENVLQRRVMLQVSDHTCNAHFIPVGAVLPESPARMFDHQPASAPLLSLLGATMPDLILLAGMRQPVERLSQQLQSHLGLATTVADPFAICACLPEVDREALLPDAPALALACGLALGARQPSVDSWLPWINLLPLHATRRQAHRRRFITGLALCLVLSSALCCASYEWLTHQLRAEEQSNLQLKQQIDALKIAPWLPLDPPPSQADLSWITQWLEQRGHAAVVLDQLAQATPSGVALTRFKQEGERYILSGHALSSDVLQRFEQNLRQIAEWRHIERQSARSSMMNQRPVLSFTLQALPLVKAAP